MTAQSIIYPRANKMQGKLWDVKLGTGTSPMRIFLYEVKDSNGRYQPKYSPLGQIRTIIERLVDRRTPAEQQDG